MKPSALISRTAALVAGIVGTLLLLEVVLRVLPVLSGTYAADPRPTWPMHTMIPNTSYTYSTGWNLQNIHRGRINNLWLCVAQRLSAGARRYRRFRRQLRRGADERICATRCRVRSTNT